MKCRVLEDPNEWYFILQDSSTVIFAEQRLTMQGQVAVAGLGLAYGSVTLLGTLTFRGSIDFMEISSLPTLASDNALGAPPLPVGPSSFQLDGNPSNNTANANLPFGTPVRDNSVVTVVGTAIDVTSPSSINFLETGVYSVDLSWTTPTGATALSAPPTYTVTSGSATSVSATYTPSAPWPANWVIAVDTTVTFATLSFQGPTLPNLTSGTPHLFVQKLG